MGAAEDDPGPLTELGHAQDDSTDRLAGDGTSPGICSARGRRASIVPRRTSAAAPAKCWTVPVTRSPTRKPGKSWLCKVMTLNPLQGDLELTEPKDSRTSSERGEVPVSLGGVVWAMAS